MAVHKKYKGIEISKDGKTPGKKKASLDIPANFNAVLEDMIKLKASDENQYKSALATIEDKVENYEDHNGWDSFQLERLLEELD